MATTHDARAADLRRRVVDEVERRADLLLDVSHRIWAEPETCFEERHAHDGEIRIENLSGPTTL